MIRLAVRLTDTVRGEKFPGTPPLALSVSLGVASFPTDGDNAEGVRRIHDEDRADRVGRLGDAPEIVADTGQVADVGQRDGPGPGVDGRFEPRRHGAFQFANRLLNAEQYFRSGTSAT